MKKRNILFFALLSFSIILNAATGTWKAYLSYHDVQNVEKASGNILYVLASNGLYAYNTKDHSIQTFSKMDYLSDCEISKIKYNAATHKLIIIYDNYNIDLMSDNLSVVNLPDYKNASVTGFGKTVNGIYDYGNYSYLSTAFGIIKVNVRDAEIADTYRLGFNVNSCKISGNYIYAESASNGEYRVLLTDNLLDTANWTRSGDYVAETEENKDSLKAIAKTLSPGGPKYNYFWFMRFTNSVLYTCGGGFGHIVETDRPGTIQVLDNSDWTVYDDDISSKTGLSYTDINTIDVDPLNKNHLFAGARNGLYEFNNGNFTKFYNSENSLISAFSNTKEYQIISSIKYDDNGNLWILNSQASDKQSLIEYTKSGEWVSHHKDALISTLDNNNSLGSMDCLIEDSRGLLWFVNNHPHNTGLFCYQPSSDTLEPITSFVNEDGTTLSPKYARFVVEDNNHNLWIGTDIGPLLLESSEINKDTPVFTQVKVPRNDGTDYADYLLSGVDITCIAIDGAGRKWFGTNNNGVYLISEDNMKQVQHFTSGNSMLLSDNIESIAINNTKGEVFFGTDKGLCSYQSDATTACDKMTKDNVWAYPNPVKPDYTGIITIVGLTYNANVKIVTSNGVLVNEGTSNGGSYTWDGKDLNGKKVASGIYMVETATSGGGSGTVCKIAIIK